MADTTQQLTVQDLFDIHHEKLQLTWIAGQQGGKRLVIPEEIKANPLKADKGDASISSIKPTKPDVLSGQSLVGYLNLIHPHQIQVLGEMELNYIGGLRDISREDAIRQLFKHQPACIIVSEGSTVPVFLKRKCNENSTPLFSSAISSIKLTDTLHYYLANLFADVITLHGVFMEVNAIGVLIIGPSGIGKSELALELITRGQRLVADDAPSFSRIAPDIINGTCPEALQDFLEVRGLGVINVRELFGDSAIKLNKYLRLIVRLEPMEKGKLSKIDRLEGSYQPVRLLDVDVPEITIPVAPGRNLAVLVECAARSHMLRISGYNAAEVLINRQSHLVERGEKK
jgi:HPr kinase/phosphorylase